MTEITFGDWKEVKIVTKYVVVFLGTWQNSIS